MIVWFLKELLVIGCGPRADRRVTYARAILIIHAFEWRSRARLNSEDALYTLCRECVITERTLNGRQHVAGPIQRKKAQHPAGLALAVAMRAQQAFQKTECDITQPRESLPQYVFLLFDITRRPVRRVNLMLAF